MELNKCVRCGSFYVSGNDVCPNCEEKDNNEIYNLKSFVEENPITTLENISFQTGISVNNLNRFIKQDNFKNFRKELKNNKLL